MLGRIPLSLIFIGVCLPYWLSAADIRCGAANVDVSPPNYPVIQNGGFIEALLKRQADPLHARALAFDDGKEKIAVVVVDSCMLPRDLCDKAKSLAGEKTGIAVNRMLISATHTHAAPSAMDYCLGSRKDPAYAAFLPGKIAEAIILAHSRLQPAKVGFAAADAGNFTKNRRWIRRSDKLAVDPFGERTVHAMMHPGHQNPDFIGPSGPVDPWLSMLSVKTADGKPLALLANFSMHYFSGHRGVSADYYGRFARAMEGRIAPGEEEFVAIMSQGTSGDLWWGDYSLPERQKWDIVEYTNGLAALAEDALEGIDYKSYADLAMSEERITLGRRLPDEKRLEWARAKVAEMGENRPRNRPEVYAEQALWIHDNPTEQVVLQALRIGDIAITGIPNEVYAITGLKLKARSPFPNTFNISLANGAAGYIPPPEQHVLGGYNTWPARTAGLEVEAEPKIVDSLLKALNSMGEKDAVYSGRRMAALEEPHSPAADEIVHFDMAAQGRREQMLQKGAGWTKFLMPEGKIAWAVPGVPLPGVGHPFAMGFADGKCHLTHSKLDGPPSSVEFWFWSGLPNNSRDITGYLYSRGNHALGISGTAATDPGRLFFANELGLTEIMPRAWNHVILTCDKGGNVRVYLNGNPIPEISTRRPLADPAGYSLTLASTRDDAANFEGRIDEITVFEKIFTPEKVTERFKSFGIDPPARPEWGEAREHKPEITKTSQIENQPLSPEETVAATHVADGYVLELVAAEPEVADPVAIDWGSDGRLWVAEMADYPYGMDGEGKPGGRVRYLEDADGDGRYEKSTVFVDGLTFPTSVMAWRDGVLITAAPDLLFANDPDGDGRAQTKILFHGFVQGNQQLRVNSLRWGLDNWVYCASGGHHVGFGKDTVVINSAGETVELGSRDFRFHPDSGELDPQSGPSQFGRVRDDFGNWFGVQNSWPLWHYVLADHDLRRNPSYAAPDPRVQVRTPGNPRVFPNKAIQKRFHSYEQAGRYTSACGPSIYRDDILFPREENIMTAFTCEPFHNVVQHHRVERDGVSFNGDRADDGDRDFFASGDRWCRPVMSRTGPDGALYIVDMYRYMIEHPDWLPPNGREELKPYYRSGDDRGRIYRIRKKDAPLRKPVRLANASTKECIAALAHSNGIIRDQAHRLLVESSTRTPASRIALTKMAHQHEKPRARLHALCVLDGWEMLADGALIAAAKDSYYAVREHAARLAAGRAALVPTVIKLSRDPDPAVALQAILSLGDLDGPAAATGLVSAAKAIDDLRFESHKRFLLAAIMSSAPRHATALAAEVASLPPPLVTPVLAMAMKNPDQLASFFGSLDSESGESMSLAVRFVSSLDEQDLTWKDLGVESHDGVAAGREKLRALANKVREGNSNAYSLLARDRSRLAADIAILMNALQDTRASAADRRMALARLLSLPPSASASRQVLGLWPKLDRALRSALLEQALRRKPQSLELLGHVKAGRIPAVTIPSERRQQLLSSSEDQVRQAAKEVFSVIADTKRSELVDSFVVELRGLSGDATKGAATFKERCAVCHRPPENAMRLGPDLRSITDRSVDGLLAAVVDPNRSVDPAYAGVTITLRNGEAFYGLVRSETGAGYTIQLLDGATKGISLESLASITPAPVSLMPEGLESGLTPQQLADLLDYVASMAEGER